MRTLYPEIEPDDRGHLDVGDGQRIYWETSGNPAGKPAVFLHGGPGGGTAPFNRQFFDPDAYRIVLLDQRGCGRSTPHVAEAERPEDLATNTTGHLIADVEAVRAHLGIDRWLVFGGSWGSTLALAYAQRYPDRVTELVLRGIFLLRRKEIDWYYNGSAGYVFPELWEQFVAPVPAAERGGDFVEAYHHLLYDDDPAVARAAAVAWSVWESATSSLLPRPERVVEASDPRFALAFARIENHYFRHGGFLAEGQLLRDISTIAQIPGVIVQGRYDIVCPVTSAWELHRAWPGSRLCIVDDAGHASNEPGIVDRLIAATDGFRPGNDTVSRPAGSGIATAIALDAERLASAEPEVRADAFDSVHRMRVATRRLRSVLRSYRKIFDRSDCDAIRAELRWLGEVLGVARDAEVRAARFERLLGEQRGELVPGPIRTRLVAGERDRYDRALAEIQTVLDGERYGALRCALDRLLETMPTGPAAGAPDAEVCRAALRADYQRVRARVRIEVAAAPNARTEALHEVRKAAKRLRYAAEAAGPTLGESADVVATEAKVVQAVLGEHRDAIESQVALFAAADAARAAHEDMFGYGLLYMAEEHAARAALTEYLPAIERLAVACAGLEP